MLEYLIKLKIITLRNSRMRKWFLKAHNSVYSIIMKLLKKKWKNYQKEYLNEQRRWNSTRVSSIHKLFSGNHKQKLNRCFSHGKHLFYKETYWFEIGRASC